jgi:hypothetical protein
MESFPSLNAYLLKDFHSLFTALTSFCPIEAFISLRESTSAHLEKVSVAAKMNRCPLDDGGG